MPNCQVSIDDVVAAEHIFGKSVSGLKGKTVQNKPDVIMGSMIKLPYEIVEGCKSVTLAFHLMYVNKVIFLVTLSRNIHFGATERLASHKEADVTKGLKMVVKMYKARGFQVNTFLSDGKFKPLRANIHDMGGQLNVTSNDVHVGDIERYIRKTVKEQACSTFHLTMFKKMPVMMIQHLISGSVFWLNAFLTDQGVSTILSPRMIMTGKSVDYHQHCKIMIGAYVQVHEKHDNSMEARTTGVIALQPTGNEQGGYNFMSLTKGKQLNCNHWQELPMPQDVIIHVHKLA